MNGDLRVGGDRGVSGRCHEAADARTHERERLLQRCVGGRLHSDGGGGPSGRGAALWVGVGVGCAAAGVVAVVAFAKFRGARATEAPATLNDDSRASTTAYGSV